MRDHDRLLDRRQRTHLATLLVAIFATALLISTCASCGAWQRGRSPHQMHDATATIKTTCATGVGFGSGVVIAPNRVLTAAHVVRCRVMPELNVTYDASAVVLDAGSGEVVARVVRYDEGADIAVLEADVSRFYSPTPIGPVPNIGDQVCASTGSMPYYALKCGIVQPRYTSTDGDINFFTPIEPGNSGSGVYDYRGRLVGIVTRYGKCSNGQICRGRATSLASWRAWVTAR